jgi:hypothetical protein
VAVKPPPAGEKKELLGANGPQNPNQENFDAALRTTRENISNQTDLV